MKTKERKKEGKKQRKYTTHEAKKIKSDNFTIDKSPILENEKMKSTIIISPFGVPNNIFVN